MCSVAVVAVAVVVVVVVVGVEEGSAHHPLEPGCLGKHVKFPFPRQKETTAQPRLPGIGQPSGTGLVQVFCSKLTVR